MKSKPVSFAILLAGAVGLIWLHASARAATNADKKGTVETIQVHGKSLEGNLEGDSPDRDVFVYLPPATPPTKTADTQWCIFCMGTASRLRPTGA